MCAVDVERQFVDVESQEEVLQEFFVWILNKVYVVSGKTRYEVIRNAAVQYREETGTTVSLAALAGLARTKKCEGVQFASLGMLQERLSDRAARGE